MASNLEDIPESPAPTSEPFPTLDDAQANTDTTTSTQSPHVRFPLIVDTTINEEKPSSTSPPPGTGITRSDTNASRNTSSYPGHTPNSPGGPRSRRFTRASTFRNIQDFSDFEPRSGWHPGAEPGVDPYKTDGGHASAIQLSAPCQITVVDFSQDQIRVLDFDNDGFVEFLREPQPAWSKCRWININGLSWDVIQAVGKQKRLHKLSIEDLMNTRNRTKTDWYSTHAYLVFTMQKLVKLINFDSDEEDHEEEDNTSWTTGRSRKRSAFSKAVRRVGRMMRKRKTQFPGDSAESPTAIEKGDGNGLSDTPTQLSDISRLGVDAQTRTLQRYNTSTNEVRTQYLEKNSALAPRQLAVIAEQVSLFITNDNTIIAFFELSADIVEKPILTRLYTEDTILRQSCDASMVAQAILDATIDLAIPVSTAYADVIGDLELDVLTKPNVKQSAKLYILITEMNKILNLIVPITNLINALRDHKTDLSQDKAVAHLQDPTRGVVITPMTHTYLGDVLDHCVLITDALQGLKADADGLINLIFNTIAAYQNESMKQLTLATIFFLPLTFLTGYFGQNFQPFDDLNRGITFFWMIAAPVCFFTVVLLMRDVIIEYIKSWWARRPIVKFRKHRMEHFKKKRG